MRLTWLTGRHRSTCWIVLKRHGVSRQRRSEQPQTTKRYEWAEAGALVHIDAFELPKFDRPGHWAHGDRRTRLHTDASEHDAYDAEVRTTVDLDPDIEVRLRALARERGVPLRVVLNDALRAGLRPASGGKAPPYVLPSRRLGLRPGINVDKALALAGELEDEEILRKLELRK